MAEISRSALLPDSTTPPEATADVDLSTAGKRTGRAGKLRKLRSRLLTTDLRSLMKNSVWSAGLSFVVMGLYLVEIMLLARYLSKEQLGIYFLIISFPELIEQVFDLRVDELMTRYLTIFRAQHDSLRAVALLKALWLADLGIALATLLCVTLFAGFVANLLFGDSNFAPLMILYGCGLFLAALDSASGSVLRVFNRFDLAFYAGVLGCICRITLVITAISLNTGLAGLIGARTIGLAIPTVLLGALSLRLIVGEFRGYLGAPLSAISEYKSELIKFALNTNVSSTIKALSLKLDVVIIGVLLSPAAVATYKVSTQLAKTLLIISDPLITAIYPQFSALVAHGKIAALNGLVKRVTLLMAALAVPMLAVVFFLRADLISLFAGEQYRDSAMVFVVSSLGIIAASVFFWLRPYFLSMGQAQLLTIGTISGTLAGVLGLCILTPIFGAIGAAVGFGLTFTITVTTNLIQLRLFKRYDATVA